jgi:hypothetical protein
MRIEGSGQRLSQVRDLAPHPTLRQIGQRERVDLTLDVWATGTGSDGSAKEDQQPNKTKGDFIMTAIPDDWRR